MPVSRNAPLRLRPLVAILATSLLAACSAAPDTVSGTPEPGVFRPANPHALVDNKVNAALFGTHVGGLASGAQPLPPRAGAIRLWDSGVSWREIEPAQGQINWAPLDTAVSQAEATGAREILWVHGSTPSWAAKDPQASGLYGPGTSSAPEKGAYLEILRQVATRYRGRITAYQAWNEANIKIFYRGSASYLAELTSAAKSVLEDVDPDALLVGASTTVRDQGPVKGWYEKYSAKLADRGWPVDAMAVHLYPRAHEGADARATYIKTMHTWLSERGWTGPVWDTEVNFGDRRDSAISKVEVGADQAAAWVARTYLDSLALGIDRVYWYGWNDHILGIDQIDSQSAQVQPAGVAFLTIQEWLAGAQWQGCSGALISQAKIPNGLTTCNLVASDGVRAQVLFAHRKSSTVTLPSEVTSICAIGGNCAAPTGGRLKVGESPVLLRLG